MSRTLTSRASTSMVTPSAAATPVNRLSSPASTKGGVVTPLSSSIASPAKKLGLAAAVNAAASSLSSPAKKPSLASLASSPVAHKAASAASGTSLSARINNSPNTSTKAPMSLSARINAGALAAPSSAAATVSSSVVAAPPATTTTTAVAAPRVAAVSTQQAPGKIVSHQPVVLADGTKTTTFTIAFPSTGAQELKAHDVQLGPSVPKGSHEKPERHHMTVGAIVLVREKIVDGHDGATLWEIVSARPNLTWVEVLEQHRLRPNVWLAKKIMEPVRRVKTSAEIEKEDEENKKLKDQEVDEEQALNSVKRAPTKLKPRVEAGKLPNAVQVTFAAAAGGGKPMRDVRVRLPSDDPHAMPGDDADIGDDGKMNYEARNARRRERMKKRIAKKKFGRALPSFLSKDGTSHTAAAVAGGGTLMNWLTKKTKEEVEEDEEEKNDNGEDLAGFIDDDIDEFASDDDYQPRDRSSNGAAADIDDIQSVSSNRASSTRVAAATTFSCSSCTYVNSVSRSTCEMCGTARPAIAEPADVSSSPYFPPIGNGARQAAVNAALKRRQLYQRASHASDDDAVDPDLDHSASDDDTPSAANNNKRGGGGGGGHDQWGAGNSNVTKQVCQYGAKCYRKNPDHLAEFSHPLRDIDHNDASSQPSSSSSSSLLSTPKRKRDDKNNGVSAAAAASSMKRSQSIDDIDWTNDDPVSGELIGDNDDDGSGGSNNGDLRVKRTRAALPCRHGTSCIHRDARDHAVKFTHDPDDDTTSIVRSSQPSQQQVASSQASTRNSIRASSTFIATQGTVGSDYDNTTNDDDDIARMLATAASAQAISIAARARVHERARAKEAAKQGKLADTNTNSHHHHHDAHTPLVDAPAPVSPTIAATAAAPARARHRAWLADIEVIE